MSEWIAVKDRLPRLHENVLFVGKKGGMFIGYIFSERVSEDGTVYVAVPNSRVNRYGKYWTPVPEPPKED